MDKKDLIFLDNEIDTNGVLVEINRKRQIEKAKRIFKRMIVLMLILGLVIGAIKLIPEIKGLINGGPDFEGDSPLLGTESDSNSDSTTETDKDANKNDENNQNSENSDTLPDKSTESENENSGTSSETDTNLEENGDKNTDTSVGIDDSKENTHKIIETGKTKYQATNESGCEFDFSTKFQKVKPTEISKKYGNDAPLVLITHSHGNESYSNGKEYSESGSFYSDSSNINSLGKIICDRLNAYGIPTIQLSELYASGSIYGSQKEYEKSLTETLKKYPSISYVFNISRGVKINDDLSMSKSYIEKNGQKLAQITLISGTSWDSASKNQTKNVRFAFDFANFLNSENDGFLKKNVISRFALSQDFSPLSVNVEIGEYANSYEEAKLSAELFATMIFKYLTS